MKFPLPEGKAVIAPSVLSADFSDLRSSLAPVNAGSGWIHFDVMDGLFVPNISFGPMLIPAVKKCSPLCVDAHLMIKYPARYIEAFAKAGADLITVHEESENSMEAVDRITATGLPAGISIKPHTPAEKIIPFLDKVSLILVMTVEPGFGGQKFMADMMPKVREIRGLINKTGRKIWLQADGGINENTSEEAVKAGADSLVMGSALFKAGNPADLITSISLNLKKLQ
jgi:ribulose-phosphate 3-epimerase